MRMSVQTNFVSPWIVTYVNIQTLSAPGLSLLWIFNQRCHEYSWQTKLNCYEQIHFLIPSDKNTLWTNCAKCPPRCSDVQISQKWVLWRFRCLDFFTGMSCLMGAVLMRTTMATQTQNLASWLLTTQ